jgi:hypothetical protein
MQIIGQAEDYGLFYVLEREKSAQACSVNAH